MLVIKSNQNINIFMKNSTTKLTNKVVPTRVSLSYKFH